MAGDKLQVSRWIHSRRVTDRIHPPKNDAAISGPWPGNLSQPVEKSCHTDDKSKTDPTRFSIKKDDTNYTPDQTFKMENKKKLSQYVKEHEINNELL